MEFDIKAWMDGLAEKIRSCFGSRVLFIGLQGSHRRGEATPESDIDVVLVLDRVSLDDLRLYRALIAEMPDGEKACGFISGRDVISEWPKHELVQFYYDTEPWFGTLESLLPAWDHDDIVLSVRMGAANLYHAICHHYLYGDRGPEALRDEYKAAFFVLRGLALLGKRQYARSKEELLGWLSGPAREILDISLRWDELAPQRAADPDRFYRLLLDWCTDVLESL